MSLSPRLNFLLSEIQGNQRLRLGSWLILFILFFYLVISISDWQRALEEEYLNVTDRCAQLRAVSEQIHWLDRAKAVKAALVQAETKLLTVESRGLAQANVQTWLDNQLKKNQITTNQVRVEAAAEISGTAGLLQVTATVEGPYDREKILNLLLLIESGPPLMSVEQLDITINKKQYFTLIFKTYFQGAAG